jgi:ABC-type glycerol-3-phosphate transport system permease component
MQIAGLRKKVNFVVINAILLLVTASFVVPFIYMFAGSFKHQEEIASTTVSLLPKVPTLANYQTIFAQYPIPQNILNSFIIAVSVTACNLFFCSLAGLAFAKYRFPGRDKLFFATLLTLMIPFQAILVPLFIMMSKLKWTDTFLPLIIPAAISAFGIFFIRQYICSSIPSELLDAARIDGCSEFDIYWRIVVPVIKPALITIGLIIFMNSWNDYLWPIIILNSTTHYTMSIVAGLAGLSPYSVNWGEKLAAAAVAALPPVIIFYFFRKQFIEAIMTGALKGV